jgi:hypothetical protein
LQNKERDGKIKVRPWEVLIKDPVTTEDESPRVCVHNFTQANTPGFPKEEKINVESYLSGYADGEGCFCVSINKSKRHKFGWEIRPSFSVSQNSNRSNVLEIFKRYFGCGTIRPDRSDKTLKYEVRCIDDLINKVIPHFEKYPLLSSKDDDAKRFMDICRMMANKEHLIKEGLNKILKLSAEINPTGKKKFLRQEIKI